jgi:hypothetical protein
METIFRAISFIGLVVSIAMTVVMFVTLRKERRIGALALLMSLAISLIMLPIFTLLTGARVRPLISVPLFVLGLVVGGLWGFTTRLAYRGEHVVGKRSLLFLLGWALSLILAQVVTLAGSALLTSVGILPMVLSTGTQVGMTCNLLLRRLFIRRPVGAQVALQSRGRR